MEKCVIERYVNNKNHNNNNNNIKNLTLFIQILKYNLICLNCI